MTQWSAATGYAGAVAAAALCTGLGLLMQPRFDLVNISMVYLVAVVVIALSASRGAAATSAVLSVLAFDFVFVPPRFAFSVDDVQYLLTFAIMLVVALVVSGLRAHERRQAALRSGLAIEAESERVRSLLLASISHDLRTPLAVISGASSSLLQGGDRLSAGERTALLKSIFDQCQSTAGLVEKVLQMTRLEAGAIEANREWVSIPEVVGTVLARLASALASHPVVVDVPADLPLVRVDAALIDQALSNLLENAARHTPPGTPVQVKAAQHGSQLLVSIEDNGHGLADCEIERVFDKFHRAPGSASGGVGLGLAICRAIVRLHGGRIWAENLADRGAAFRFTLPLEPAPAPPPENGHGSRD